MRNGVMAFESQVLLKQIEVSADNPLSEYY